MMAEIHENAQKHGWWEEDRQYGEIIALIHSELSEALEEHRDSKPLVYDGENGKPEGCAVELIDAVIRILDYLGRVEMVFGGEDLTLEGLMDQNANQITKEIPLPALIAELHYLVSDSYDLSKKTRGFVDAFAHPLITAMSVACQWVRSNGLNAEMILRKKHEFNIGRLYKHGKAL